jgi:excisionase family DNA binding protein
MTAIVHAGRNMLAAEQQMYSLEDVAERLQVSDRTVRRWIKGGDLAAYKPGREYRITPEDLAKFLESRRVRPGEESGG